MASMSIQRSFEILELERGATLEEARQAYKDVVNVWHPDRFSANPRLKHKAEQKVKEVNVAYETVKAFLERGRSADTDIRGKAAAAPGQTHRDKDTREEHPARARSRTEITAEIGTVLVLDLYSYLSARLNHWMGRDRA